MYIKNIKGGYAFTRNPIILQANFPATVFDKQGGKVTVTMSGTNIFEGRFFPPLNMDISEIVDAHSTYFWEPPKDNNYPVVEIWDYATLCENEIYVCAEYATYEEDCKFMAIPGGISKQNFRRLAELRTDIFLTRFQNPKCNFFLTTRTAGWRVVIKETELYPLYFFIHQQNEQIDVVETILGKILTFDGLDRGVYALDIDALRRKFMAIHRVIPNIFDVYMAGVFSCRIVVEHSDISKERYRLKFRNSLGVFEIIELTGKLSVSPEYDEADDATFKRYDSLTGDFCIERERVERRQTITVETGIKRPDEVRFLMDMIASDEVYLLDLAELPIKVIPSVEDFSYSPRPDSPEKFSIKLTAVDTETNIMQDIIDGMEGRKPRVFTNQFSKQFN